MASGRTSTLDGQLQTRRVAGLSDGQLLKLFAIRRDSSAEPAFAELVRRHSPMVLGVCRQLLADPHDAEDAFQVTFLVLARKAGSIRRPELLRHWLYGVAARRAKALAGRRRRHEARERTMVVSEPLGDRGQYELRLSRREEAEMLHQEVGRLPEKYRLPIVLCYLEGLTHTEAAARLRWPEGTLSVRLMRARELLRARLTRRGLAPTAGLLVVTALSKTASAEGLPALAQSTARAALRSAAGQAVRTGMAAKSVAVLKGKVLIAMMTREALFGISLVAVLVAGLIVAGARSIAFPPKVSPEPDRIPGRQAAVPRRLLVPEIPRRAPMREQGVADPRSSETDRETRTEAGRGPTGDLAPPSAPPEAPAILVTYRRLASRAGRDPEAQVRLALWCEAQGLIPERFKHLALAVLIDPDHAPARGLLGQVAHRGGWHRPEAIRDQILSDTRLSAALDEYKARRERMECNAEAHWKLALWCERKGLNAEAQAHLTAITRLDPGRAAAWRRLGCKDYNGRWARPEQITAERAALEGQRRADQHWRPLLAEWKAALQDDARRAWAEGQLAAVTDPRAVPAIWTTFARGGPGDQALAAQMLGQIESPAASRALALLTVFSDSAEVRRSATEFLTWCDPRDFIGLLIGFLRDPIQYEVRPALGPGMPGALFVEGRRFHLRLLYDITPQPFDTIRQLMETTRPPDEAEFVATILSDNLDRLAAGRGPHAFENLADIKQAEAEQATLSAQREMADDIAAIEVHNRAVREANGQIESILNVITGRQFGEEGKAWRRWWRDQQGEANGTPRLVPKPMIDQPAAPAMTPNDPVFTSSFGSGTPVRTREGTRPIESIRVGDVVLTQEAATGGLVLAPVLSAVCFQPAPTLRVVLGDEPIEVTGIHRFWKAGEGWVMARDLEPGDAVRTLDGLVRVSAVAPDRVQPLFNLEVGATRGFFVGRAGALVHDNSPVQPIAHPFDAVPDLVAPAPGDGDD